MVIARTPTRPLPLLAVALILASCGDQTPTAPPSDVGAPQMSVGPAAGFPLVTVRQGLNKPSGTPGPIVDNLADAVARVKDGGRIVVRDGTYAADSIMIGKSVTIESAPGAAPVVESTRVGLVVSAGDVVIRGLSFVNKGTSASVFAYGAYRSLLVEQSSFTVDGTFGHGLFASGSSETEVLTIQQSTFSGGLTGMFIAGTQDFTVSGVNSSDHSFSGIQIQGGAQGRVEGSTLQRCGPAGCIRVFPSRVEIIGNTVSNEVGRFVRSGIFVSGGEALIENNDVIGTGGNAFEQGAIQAVGAIATFVNNRVSGARNGLYFTGGTSGEILDNTVDPCGTDQCVLVHGGSGSVRIAGNQLRSSVDHKTNFGILSHNWTGAGSIVIEDNTLWGAGVPVDPTQWNDSYAFTLSGIQIGGFLGSAAPAGTATVSRNTIHNSHQGLVAVDGMIVVGSDNVLSLNHQPLKAWNGASLTIHRSDVTEYQVPVNTGPGAAANFDLTCNWWASAAGPQGGMPPSITSSVYTPWATQPIAGNTAVDCS